MCYGLRFGWATDAFSHGIGTMLATIERGGWRADSTVVSTTTRTSVKIGEKRSMVYYMGNAKGQDQSDEK